MKKNTAFVAMKFDGDHWKDKRYSIISEILKEAGFDPVRADQIKSSGPVVEEVCNYLEKSPLVVIDDTGDSLSVAYEIGYCHGIKREPEKTILLRHGHEIPFNYRHFRHHCYKDLRHLRRLLRDWLSLLVPLLDEHYGYTFTFEVLSEASDYGATAADCFLKSLHAFKFTGRAEFFAADERFGKEEFYKIGVGLKFADKKIGKKSVPDYRWWMKFRADVINRLHATKCGLEHADTMSEMDQLGAIRQTMMHRATAQFENGLPTLLIGGDLNPEESWFIFAIQDLMNNEATIEPN
jgi:hypothetical protein